MLPCRSTVFDVESLLARRSNENWPAPSTNATPVLTKSLLFWRLAAATINSSRDESIAAPTAFIQLFQYWCSSCRSALLFRSRLNSIDTATRNMVTDFNRNRDWTTNATGNWHRNAVTHLMSLSRPQQHRLTHFPVWHTESMSPFCYCQNRSF